MRPMIYRAGGRQGKAGCHSPIKLGYFISTVSRIRHFSDSLKVYGSVTGIVRYRTLFQLLRHSYGLPLAVGTVLNSFPVVTVGHPHPPFVGLACFQRTDGNGVRKHVFLKFAGIDPFSYRWIPDLQPIVKRGFLIFDGPPGQPGHLRTDDVAFGRG